MDKTVKSACQCSERGVGQLITDKEGVGQLITDEEGVGQLITKRV